MQPFVQVFILIIAGVAEIIAIIYYALRLHRKTSWQKQPGQEEARNTTRRRQSITYHEPSFPTNNKEVEHIWNFYIELGLMERHFNVVQSDYRRLASTWLLAVFAAIGFVLSTKLTILMPPALLILGLGIAGSIGVYLIWVLDLLVTQRPLDASFMQNKDLETKYKWLPQVRNHMRTLLRGKGLRLVVWFYIGATEVMAFTAGIGLLLWLSTTSTRVGIIYLVTADYLIGMFLILMLMHVKTSITPHLEEQIRASRGSAAGENR